MDRFDLRRDIQCNTQVISAIYDNATNHWSLKTDQEDQVSARYCITAMGCLSTPNTPAFLGLASFVGRVYDISQ